MKLFGDEARSYHTVLVDRESAGRLLVDHDGATMAIVSTIGQMHMESH